MLIKNKKLFIILIIIVVLIIIFTILIKNKFKNESMETTINSTDLNKEIDKNNQIMLADILKEREEIIITEDNIDKTHEIINRANLQKGVFISEHSREKFLEIINIATENIYLINDDGYLEKPRNILNESDLTKKINNYIDSNETIVINISNTYKGLLNNMLLDFMIERTMYVQTFEYNDNIKIALINPDRIIEQSEDLSQKQIYEEILLGL